jgi:hypothetical protein
VALTLTPLRNPQAFFPPKPLNLFVIHMPAFPTCIVIGRPEPSARMVFGVSTQPLSQRGVRIKPRRCRRHVALSGAVLPGHAAGEPLADPQHPLELTNGRAPAFRA